ncbi:MAG TPA: polysaccharide biosynthesis/export family protein [Phycisphaerae bacterium]|nr:polysaccharide biosynthesis/export family protein [Phycisphaerae bacterium]
MAGIETNSERFNMMWVGLLALSLVMMAGCSQKDHRIGLDEFLQIQDEFTQNAPADDAALSTVHLNSKLGQYTVGSGDVLELSISVPGVTEEQSALPTLVRVDHAGRIDIPQVGDVQVGGMELEEVEDAITAAYTPGIYTNPNDVSVYVGLKQAAPTNVLVHGAVTKPGLTKLRRTERNLLYAIHAAGGLSDISAAQVTLSRLRCPDDEVTLNIATREGLAKALSLDPLEDGDIITVETAKVNAIFVGGLVRAPQTQVYPPGVHINTLQAIAAAGGLRTDVSPRAATLIRRMPDGQDVHVKLDLNRLAIGEDPNLMLAAGDILWVPETTETRIQDWINKNIFIRAGLNASVSYNVSGIEFLNRHGSQSGGSGGGNLQDSFDPFGFLNRNAGINLIQSQTGG